MTAVNASTEGFTKNPKDPTFYRHDDNEDDENLEQPPPPQWPQRSSRDSVMDYRAAHPNQGPLLSYIWCNQPLQGQNLFLGAEVGSDGNVYCIPGHADRVMKLDPANDAYSTLIGPVLHQNMRNGGGSGKKYKWLRGVRVGDCIYGLPCHADTVLKIHTPTGRVTQLPIQYETFFGVGSATGSATGTAADTAAAQEAATRERHQEWKYHGGNVSPVDGCIYAIPQSASHVLQIDPRTDLCTPFGPALLRNATTNQSCKWYGGVVGKQDGAVYGIPHSAAHVLRIHPVEGVTLHGDFSRREEGDEKEEGHLWHGAAAAPNGVIVCVPANADTVLCITPGAVPVLTEIGDATVVQSGRHRRDKKYKFLGATAGPDGRVYCFPCAAERVLAVDTVHMTVAQVGPNIYDAKMERLCQNKWQNGVYVPEQNCILGIPLAGESLLKIDFNTVVRSISNGKDEPEITTWPIPYPHRCLGKWEGAVVAPNGAVYTIPNNHKAILRIELPPPKAAAAAAAAVKEATATTELITSSTTISGTSNVSSSSSSHSANKPDRPDYSHREDLVYKSGIPTLRASAHRVKFSLKNRKHDPKPKNARGDETGTLWLPEAVCKEDLLSYDLVEYDLPCTIASLLKRCDPDIVGGFVSGGSDRLEDFRVPTKSTWRTVNGGQCESAQRYLSDAVESDGDFLRLFDRLVTNVVLPHLKDRLVAVGALNADEHTTFYYQRPPTLRLQPGPAWAQVKAHNDAEYGHQNGELNFWLPLTNRDLTGVDLWCETNFQADDYHPIPAKVGEIISFHGSSCRHYVNTNATCNTRASFDFRVGVQGFFDPVWEMQGTNDDHTRREFTV